MTRIGTEEETLSAAENKQTNTMMRRSAVDVIIITITEMRAMSSIIQRISEPS